MPEDHAYKPSTQAPEQRGFPLFWAIRESRAAAPVDNEWRREPEEMWTLIINKPRPDAAWFPSVYSMPLDCDKLNEHLAINHWEFDTASFQLLTEHVTPFHYTPEERRAFAAIMIKRWQQWSHVDG